MVGSGRKTSIRLDVRVEVRETTLMLTAMQKNPKPAGSVEKDQRDGENVEANESRSGERARPPNAD